MDTVYLRSLMLENKDFLAKLFKGKPRQNCREVLSASEKKLNLLIKILHLVCNGHIRIAKEHFNIILKSKRMGLLKSKFEKKASFLSTLGSTVAEKQQVLRQFCALYPLILHFVFTLKRNETIHT